MRKGSERLSKELHIHTVDNIIYQVSAGFLEVTGYNESDLVGKSLLELGVLLKSEHQMSFQVIENRQYGYIFNSDHLPLEVKVSVDSLGNEDYKVYHFEEQKDSALEYTLNNFGGNKTNGNGATAVYSYPDCILLSHDENYITTLCLMNIASDNPIGRCPSFPTSILDVLKRGTSCHEFEVESRGSDGAATYWDINVKMIAGEGTRQYAVTSFYNVTEKTRERKLLTKQKNEMEFILDNMSDAVNILDKDGEYTYINKVGKQFPVRYIPQNIPDIESVNSERLYHAFRMNDTNGEKSSFEDIPEQRVLRGEKLTKHMVVGARELTTAYYECAGTPIYDEEGNIDGGILIYKNSEPSYKIEEYTALQESVEKISMYYASFSHKDHKINYLNQFSFKAFKEEWPEIKTESDIIGKNFFNYYRTEDLEELVQNINISIENKSAYLHKLEFTKDGITYHTKTIFQPIINQHNEVEKIIALGIDISDEELAKKSMEKLLKDQEELFINTSHELKTPLTVISSGAQLLDLYLEHDSLEEYREDILNVNKMTIRNCYRLNRLINNILDISKIDSGLYELYLTNYNIVAIVDDIVESVSQYTKSKGINIIFDPDFEELIMAVDVSKFDRILLNLISNAIKFSIPGEAILIRLVKKDDHTVSVSVKDEGIGIDQKNTDVIFKKFTQLNRNFNRIAEGTGLGLPIAKSLAELHGGSISVESILDEGSTFTIELPIKKMDSGSSNRVNNSNLDRIELIKYEFSDIYF
ncbi:PAS domain-containing sensor histidine kinase [Sporosarcina gallistercoris]|uniref:histidine kinase n=1 Tax=Sporosarcina gallistercoris TaxID=2762245 RepID=A0ABR8PH25_9BACL|nr:PAS domain-containing sensor histidine kinase [Sporosarcina gallistercoris]MBD7907470.1 PAS domain-containing sensor histidine kinase [Sporosarcina gallistercoris]